MVVLNDFGKPHFAFQVYEMQCSKHGTLRCQMPGYSPSIAQCPRCKGKWHRVVHLGRATEFLPWTRHIAPRAFGLLDYSLKTGKKVKAASRGPIYGAFPSSPEEESSQSECSGCLPQAFEVP